MRMILQSCHVNDNAYDISKINCLPEHSYLMKYYWGLNFKYRYLIKFNLYWGNNNIKEKSIIRSLIK